MADERYQPIRQLAEGPTTTVWLARDTVTGADVVLKRLAPAARADTVARRRLQEEAAVAASVSHPNAVPILDSRFDGEDAFLVFPYVAGTTLAERLREGPSLSPREAATISLEISDALAAAHAAAVVHRDVKAANILLAADGQAHLVDFGIAQAGDDVKRAELTGTGMAVGTLPYMAPEQLTGGAATAASDVYGLGVVLYESLAGRRPYEGGSPAEQLELQSHPPPAIPAAAPLAALALSALDPLPERRPSAAQLGRSLRAWLDGRLDAEAATSAVSLAPAAQLPRSGGRMTLPAAAVIAALVIGAVAIAAVGSGLGGGQPASLPQVAVEQTPSPEPATAPLAPPLVRPADQRLGAGADDDAPRADNDGKKKEGKDKKNKGKGKGRDRDGGDDGDGHGDGDGDD